MASPVSQHLTPSLELGINCCWRWCPSNPVSSSQVLPLRTIPPSLNTSYPEDQALGLQTTPIPGPHWSIRWYVWSETFITMWTKGCVVKSSCLKKPKRKTMAVRLDHIWGIMVRKPRGDCGHSQDRSSNQRLRKLGPLEAFSKLKRRNLFWLFVPSGIWVLPGSLPHVPSRRALAQNRHWKNPAKAKPTGLSWKRNTRLGLGHASQQAPDALLREEHRLC